MTNTYLTSRLSMLLLAFLWIACEDDTQQGCARQNTQTVRIAHAGYLLLGVRPWATRPGQILGSGAGNLHPKRWKVKAKRRRRARGC
jgi:hypothetical protein